MAPSSRLTWEVGPLTDFAIELACVTGRAPRVCFLATATGDNAAVLSTFYSAAQLRGLSPSHLTVFPMPNVPDVTDHLREQDVIWVGGGSVAGMLAMWRLHGIDEAMRQAWEAGVVLAGVSAGSICWHVGGPTDSFGPTLQPVTDGLALLPYGNGVHYDSEEQRRPLLHRLVGEGVLPRSYATDDTVGVLYEGVEPVAVVTDAISGLDDVDAADPDGPAAYLVELGDDGVEERRLQPGPVSV